VEIPTGPTIVYRKGGAGPSNLTPRPPRAPGDEWDDTGLSTWNSLGAVDAGKPAFSAGDRVAAIDLSKLNNLRGVPDDPPGHVSIQPIDMSQLEAWAASKGSKPPHPLTQEIVDSDPFVFTLG
jgi:hypothetical protein